MPKASPILSTFNGGEFSPMLTGRVDFEKYRNGGEVMENFLPTVPGPMVRRGGTRYVSEVKDSSKRVFLQRFEFSVDQAYTLEFGDQYVRFYTLHGQLVNMAVPVEVATPYTLADLFAPDGTCRLQFAQSGDFLYITHPMYAPRVLKRTTPVTFVLETLVFTGGPFESRNTTSTAVYATTRTGITELVATDGIFTSGRVGAYFELEQRTVLDVKAWEPGKTITVGAERRSDGKNYIALNSATTGANKPVHTEGAVFDGDNGVQWLFTDPGYGYVRITALVNTPAVTRTVTNAVGASGLVRLTVPAHGFVTGDPVRVAGILGTTEANGSWFVTAVDANTIDLIGTTFVNAYVSGGTASSIPNSKATAEVIDQLPSNTIGHLKATTRWSHGEWSAFNGYPSSVTFFRERLVYARGQQVWFSVASDFSDFSAKDFGTITADMAISITISSGEINQIQWLFPDKELLAGTAGGEFTIGELANGDPLGPGNIKAELRTRFGSRSIVPIQKGTDTLFVQRSGRKVREIGYDFSSDAYRANDATVLADHITESGIVDMDFAQEPYSLGWLVRADGTLIAFTWDNEQNVKGWHRHPTDGFVESVACIPAPDQDRDELWLVVRRVINGVTKRYVEYMERPWQREDSIEDQFYVDCGLTYSGAPADMISGLGHLEGKTVDILADGSPHPQRVVTGGQVLLQNEYSVVHIGLPAPCRFKSMRLEAGGADGTAQGKTKRITRLVIRFLESLGGMTGPSEDVLESLEFRTPADPMNVAVPLFTGDKVVQWPTVYDRDAYFYYENTQPLAVTVVAVMPEVHTQANT